jgi:hypothetical protein
LSRRWTFAALGVNHDADPDEKHVTIFVPLVEVEGDLQNLPSTILDRLRSCIRNLESSGTPVRLTITGLTGGREPAVAVKLSPSST